MPAPVFIKLLEPVIAPDRVAVPDSTSMVSVPLKEIPFDAVMLGDKRRVVPSAMERVLEPKELLLPRERLPEDKMVDEL